MNFTIDLTEQTLPANSEAGYFLASLQQELITSEVCDNLTCDDGELRVSDNYGMDFEEERALYIRADAEIAKLKELLAMDNATAIHRFSREKTYCQ